MCPYLWYIVLLFFHFTAHYAAFVPFELHGNLNISWTTWWLQTNHSLTILNESNVSQTKSFSMHFSTEPGIIALFPTGKFAQFVPIWEACSGGNFLSNARNCQIVLSGPAIHKHAKARHIPNSCFCVHNYTFEIRRVTHWSMNFHNGTMAWS